MSQINRELQLTIQSAAREAVARRNSYLTIEHLLFALCHDSRGVEVLRNCGVNLASVKKALEKFFSDDLERIDSSAESVETKQTLAFHRVIQAALHHADSAEKEEVEAGDLIAALFQEPDSFAVSVLRSEGMSRLDALRYLSHGTRSMEKGSSEPTDEKPTSPEGGFEEDGTIEDPLDAFASNLTVQASEGILDPLVGRNKEIERAVHILARRRKNNPLFVGETGVGKTALAEGLAQRILAGDVPRDLKSAEIFSLDLGALLAGTRFRGDFEARFKALVVSIRERENPILFIDEIHTILGAGAAQGATVDVSNLLKPLLQNGQLRCMGSTTYQEFRHFERDRALARRFQRIDVAEPSIEETIKILQGLAPRYETHHGIRYTAAALRGAAELSARHINDRFLPDKAIDVMDEVGAAVRLRSSSKRRNTVGIRDVEAQISRIAGIPMLRATGSERDKLSSLEEELSRVVFGQIQAVGTVARAVKRSRAGLSGAERPMGSFLFSGPTGVGKTELAKQLASSLGVSFLRFDMSEYMEKHSVARLIGAPPGYVGYDEGGQLVESVRKNPNAVVLLDEIEKAHQDLFSILLQVMDRATLTDNHGREADFRHVTLIMTTNAGAREMAERQIGFIGGRRGDGGKEIERLFSPEFRNRLDEVVHFENLSPEVMVRVVDKFVEEVRVQLLERKIQIELDAEARKWLAGAGYDPDFGARPLDRVIQEELKDRISDEILFGVLEKGGIVRVSAENNALSLSFEGLAK
tara:strand:- start:5814 stop:8078 length:2265 start_codon:yes stop_codon:yes gene_type:complete